MAPDQRRTLARLSGLIQQHRLYLAGGVWHIDSGVSDADAVQ
jgi:hypothetical protein